jgi:hypothetical protein
VEDGLLAGWVGVVQPLASSTGVASEPASPFIGAVMVLAVIGAIVCLGTRPPDQPDVALGNDSAPRWLFAGPLVGALALIGSEGLDRLSRADFGWLGGPLAIAAIAALLLNPWLPVVPTAWRRVLVMPFVLVSATFFNDFTAGLLEGLDLSDLSATIGTDEASFAAFVLVMLLGGLATFYTMLVVAPRELADPEPGGWRWPLRFVLFLAASVTGIAWLAALA